MYAHRLTVEEGSYVKCIKVLANTIVHLEGLALGS